MARIRTIKPQFFLNEELSELPAMARLLFIGLWLHADREGRLYDRPKRLKAEIFPYENYDVEKGLKQLSDAEFILRYKVDAAGVSAPEQPITELAIIQIINFSKHQKIDKVNEKESELPEPQHQDYSKTTPRLLKAGEGNGRERNGMEGDARFLKPEKEELINYFSGLGLDDFTAMGQAQKFHDYYESKGWLVGKTKMKDWKAAARGWKERMKNFDYERTKGSGGTQKPGTSEARIEALENLGRSAV